jgi:hypothetical protein
MVLIESLSQAEAWHAKRGVDARGIANQPVRHLTTLSNEGFFGQVVAGCGSEGLTMMMYGRAYGRIGAILRARAANWSVGYSDPTTNRSYSKKIDVRTNALVETNLTKAIKINREKAKLLDGGESTQSLTVLSSELLSHAKQNRIRAHTRERAGSEPLFLHYMIGDDERPKEDEQPVEGGEDVELVPMGDGLGSQMRHESGAVSARPAKWHVGSVVAVETGANSGYAWFAVLQSEVSFNTIKQHDGGLMKKANEKEVTVQWLETKEKLGEEDIDGDMEYVEGHVEDIPARWLFDCLRRAEVRTLLTRHTGIRMRMPELLRRP